MSQSVVVTVSAREGEEDALYQVLTDAAEKYDSIDGRVENLKNGRYSMYLHGDMMWAAESMLRSNTEVWEYAGVVNSNDWTDSGFVIGFESDSNQMEQIAKARGDEGQDGRDAAEAVSSELGFTPEVE